MAPMWYDASRLVTVASTAFRQVTDQSLNVLRQEARLELMVAMDAAEKARGRPPPAAAAAAAGTAPAAAPPPVLSSANSGTAASDLDSEQTNQVEGEQEVAADPQAPEVAHAPADSLETASTSVPGAFRTATSPVRQRFSGSDCWTPCDGFKFQIRCPTLALAAGIRHARSGHLLPIPCFFSLVIQTFLSTTVNGDSFSADHVLDGYQPGHNINTRSRRSRGASRAASAQATLELVREVEEPAELVEADAASSSKSSSNEAVDDGAGASQMSSFRDVVPASQPPHAVALTVGSGACTSQEDPAMGGVHGRNPSNVEQQPQQSFQGAALAPFKRLVFQSARSTRACSVMEWLYLIRGQALEACLTLSGFPAYR